MSSLISSSESMDCPLSIELLRQDNLRLTSKCPRCDIAVHAHKTEVQLAGSAPAAVQDQPRSVLKWEHTKMCTLTKDIRWLKHAADQISADFFDQLEVRLAPFREFQDSFWIYLIPQCMENPEDAKWVQEFIVDRNPTPAWADARRLFGEQFDTVNIKERNRSEFNKCRQKSEETAQEFTTRFMRLCRLCGYHEGDHEARSVDDMVDRLQSDLQWAFRLQLSNLRQPPISEEAQNRLNQLRTLQGAAQYIIQLSISIGPRAHARIPERGPESSRKRLSSSNKPMCIYHPNASSHTTAECRNKRARFPDRYQDSSSSASAPFEAKSNVVCHHCKQPGHIKPKCPELQKFQGKSGAAVAAESKPSGFNANSKPQSQGGAVKPSDSQNVIARSLEVHEEQTETVDDENHYEEEFDDSD